MSGVGICEPSVDTRTHGHTHMEAAFRSRTQGQGSRPGDRAGVHRPPVYNSEDYTQYLRKYCKYTGLQLYLNLGPDSGKGKSKPGKTRGEDGRIPGDREMGLRQFTDISELLSKLKTDLHLSYQSFLKEFISEPNDGVALLLDLLKIVQLSQTNIAGLHTGLDSKLHQSVFKKALADEHECLLCLKLCAESEDGSLRLAEHCSGLFTVSVCVMSNFSKSRVLALQLLTQMCCVGTGHKQVSDAISMLRLRFGEPVRFKFLIGMLNSFNSGSFQISCLRFINTFLETAVDYRERLHIQADLEEAGLELGHLKRLVSKTGNQSELLQQELTIWDMNYIEVNTLVTDRLLLQRNVDKLRGEILEERRRREQAEVREENLRRELTDMRERCEQAERRLREEGLSSSGLGSVHSDQDSGKHSDISLAISSEDCWAEIDKVNQDYIKKEADKEPLEELVRVVTISSPCLEEEQHVRIEQDTRQEEELLVQPQTITVTKPPRSKVGRSTSYVNNQTYGHNIYDEVPFLACPKIGRTGGKDEESRRRLEELMSEEEEEESLHMRRMPRPPVRRRLRGGQLGERPKSAPPEKLVVSQYGEEKGKEMIQLRDGSEGETSDTNGGTLETVSARSINFVRPSQRLLEREQHKRLKRHKSFFNTESLFTKKNSIVRRAESFHQGPAQEREGGHGQGQGWLEARVRARSVDRILGPGLDTSSSQGRLKKSKSMEFLKCKILRRPSKGRVCAPPVCSQSQSQTSPDCTTSGTQSVSPGIHTVHTLHTRKDSQHYDWRQDTPFWRNTGQRQDTSRSRSHYSPLSHTPPPTWSPPPPPSHHLAPTYPNMSLAQAVNSVYLGEGRMYLPVSSSCVPVSPYMASSGDSILEITELEDGPLCGDGSFYRQTPANILQLPQGLY